MLIYEYYIYTIHYITGTTKTLGSAWNGAAISNAEWSGVRLLDLLIDSGLDVTHSYDIIDQLTSPAPTSSSPLTPTSTTSTTPTTSSTSSPRTSNLHVQFAAADGMEASVPLTQALDRLADVTLAYEMNKEPLPSLHGYPIRVIVPGHVGVRNVKWADRITVAAEEAQG